MIDIEEQKQLAVEIFALTGCKVGAEDPVVIAALFYSERMRVTFEAHRKLLERQSAESKQRLDQTIEAAAKQLASQADAGRAKQERQLDELLRVARNAVHSEVPTIKRQLERFAKELRSSFLPKPKDSFAMTLTSLIGSLILAATASSLVTAMWLGKLDLTALSFNEKASSNQSTRSESQAEMAKLDKRQHPR